MEVAGLQAIWIALRDRKLIQWCVAYAAGAWLVMQVVDVVAGRWMVPLPLQRAVDVLLLAGFFVTLTVAWYHGEKGRQRISGPELLILAMLFVLAGLGLLSLRPAPTVGEGPSTAADEGVAAALERLPGLAVLPFANRSGEPDDVYFTDGVYDELLTRLQRIPGMRVISRTSAEVYRDSDKTIPSIGEELGVDYVLEGGVQRVSERVRVNLQLIDARSEGHVWAQTYDRLLNPTELLDIQSEVVRAVAGELGVALRNEEWDRWARRSTRDPGAYDLYTRGVEASNRGDMLKAETLFREAAERDPDFVAAHFAVARTAGANYLSWGRSAERAEWIQSAALKALEIDPDAPDAHLAMGIYHYRVSHDWEQALEWLGRAAGTLRGEHYYQYYRATVERRMGRWVPSVSSMEAAVTLSPRALSPRQELGITLLSMRRYAEAERVLREAIALFPDAEEPYFLAGETSWARDGDTAPWLEATKRFESPFKAWELRMILGDPAGALAALEDGPAVWTAHQQWRPKSLCAALALEAMGRSEEARAAYGEAIDTLETLVATAPDDERYRSSLGLAYAGLGRGEDALREATTATELMPPQRDALGGPFLLFTLAGVRARLGDVEGAVENLERILMVPSRYSAPMLRRHYLLRPLWDEPLFLGLLEREPGRVF
ncbi:MAG: BTAD domain-containing putative transcriptional regulator [Longimicrobiales bacterium]